MKKSIHLKKCTGSAWLHACAAALAAATVLTLPSKADFNLNVVDDSGAPVSNFRWLLEEDNTARSIPGTPVNDSASLVIHKSHATVKASGVGAAGTALVSSAPSQRYMLSVLADGYEMSGVNVAAGQTTARVVLNRNPLPTAQISVLAFHDSAPINNVPDAGEPGLAGFKVILHDFLGGPILQDAFGNPLGTTYLFDGGTGEPIMVEGAPSVNVLGDGNIYTDANGKALVKYLPMGKYGVQVIPPIGADWTGGHGAAKIQGAWHQTATIEGTATVDAWVKANEPAVFMEGFGPGNYHVFFGFVDPATTVWATNRPAAGALVTGSLRYNHFGRPPNNQQFVAGPAVPEGWVALNELNGLGVAGRALYTAPCDPATGQFWITNVPPGTYQLVTWDKPLDALFGTHVINVPNSPTYNLGDLLTFRWFGTYQGSVFNDQDQDGFRDANEAGIPQQVINIRWRDGTIYQSTVTDGEGSFTMQEVFPFFKWLVGEVDFGRYKPTGLTAVVDEGGAIPADAGWTAPSDGVRNPQPQYEINLDGTQNTNAPINNPNTGNNLSRTETGPVLTTAFHLFLNQNNRIDWGKAEYSPGENGGISGVVGYQVTRAEEDPRNGTIDPWESGVPRVQVALYRDANSDKIIDDLDGSGGPTPADVDNYPLGWANGGAKGPEDVDHNNDGTFNPGDAVQIVWSDSWDDSAPTGSQQPNPPVILGTPIIGSDNYATWNQIRPGVFDGGYAFGSYFPGGMANTANTNVEVEPLPPGDYIVQAFPPPSYLVQTEESLNVVFGNEYKPSKLWLAPECVGTPVNHAGDSAYVQSIVPSTRGAQPFKVADFLSLFPGRTEAAPFAGAVRPLADMKWVHVNDRKNAACDFHIYTEVPKATRVVGFVLNDLTAEFNAVSPIFGEKGSPGWLPVSFRDWAGHEVARVYSDEYGTYNALLPSTYNVAAPAPSGVSPNMLTLVLNDPTMPDPAHPGNRIPDPNYNPAFATTPWTLHYYPGTLLYADTPIVPQAGFVGGPNKQLDVEAPTETPVIKSVVTSDMNGPFLSNASGTVTITSLGSAVSVPDPNCIGYGCNNTITRDFSFGADGTAGNRVLLVVNDVTNDLTIVSWSADQIVASLPPALTTAPVSGQVLVTRGSNGRTTPLGITLTFDAAPAYAVHVVTPVDPVLSPLATPIQDAIDASNPGDLIIVPPSPWDYTENPILWKPLRLQGAGLATTIQASTTPAERLFYWHLQMELILGGSPFIANEAPGFMVVGLMDELAGDPYFSNPAYQSRIDGFQIKGAIAGGGIGIFELAHNLRVSNNRIIGNQGSYAGGIAIGEPGQVGNVYANTNVTIEFNQILQNGGILGAGGIGIYHGATGYKVRNNLIVGNFTRGSGGGIGHEGTSPGGLIANNTIAYNEVFYGVPAANVTLAGDGGGIFIAGSEALLANGLNTGAGSVTIINNLIQGNLAGAGHGGGIRVAGFNGQDVVASANPANWYGLDIINNTIVNNAAGFSGGGISLQNVAQSRIMHNTIANNDSTATAQSAFAGGPVSIPRGAGVAAHLHDAPLANLTGQAYSDPVLVNNIIWHNRSFSYDRNLASLIPSADFPVYADLHVETESGLGLPPYLHPTNCLLSAGGYPSGSGNITGDPKFVAEVLNVNLTAAIIDEAGNNIALRFTPTGLITPVGANTADYHVGTGSAAFDQGAGVGATAVLALDFDGEARAVATPDIGADEFVSAGNSIFPPRATEILVAIAGPLPTGNRPPTTTPANAPSAPPGQMVKPTPLNPPPADRDALVDTDGDGIRTNDVRYFHLAAGDGFAKMADGQEMYSFGFANMEGIPDEYVQEVGKLQANLCGPTMTVKEGQHFYIDLSNVGMMMRPDLFDPHTVHFHGFPEAASIFDGEPMASVSINMGSMLRYYYNVQQPGTYFYHCHVEATEHMQMGMIGNLWVNPIQNHRGWGPTAAIRATRRAQLGGNGDPAAPLGYAYNDGDGSTAYDVEAPLQITGFDRTFHEQHILVQPLPFSTLRDDYPMFNGRGYPDTVNTDEIVNSAGVAAQKTHSLIRAKVGQRVLLRLSNVSESDFQTVTVMGAKMRIIAKDARLLRRATGNVNLSYNTTSLTLGGGESADAIVDTAGLAPGTYLVYSTRLNFLSNDKEDYGGLMTELILE